MRKKTTVRAWAVRPAFTLIELLIVIAIIAILAAILFPVLATARSNARRTTCISQLRQVGMALSMYRQDFDELPPRLSALCPAYVSHSLLLRCPSDRKQAQYAGTDRLEGWNYLPSGVNYTFVPRWKEAVTLGWWQLGPPFGQGKWEDQTPVVICDWHWARAFHADWEHDKEDARGWQLVLNMTGTVRKRRVEEPMAQFSPEQLR